MIDRHDEQIICDFLPILINLLRIEFDPMILCSRVQYAIPWAKLHFVVGL